MSSPPPDGTLLAATVTEAVAPERVDRVALALFPVLASGSQIRKLCRKDRVRLDGEVIGPMTTASPGQRLEVVLPPVLARAALALELDILWQDDDLAVVWKPAGLVTSGHHKETLARALPHNLPPSPLPDALPRPHPVHRLDARTRGLVVCARTAAAAVGLGRAFQERTVHKQYRALVSGALYGQGVVDEPIDDRPARSRWRSVQVSPSPKIGAMTTVDLWPETGRKHQLRRHLAHLGHPILGDGRYTPDDQPVLRGQGLMLAAVGLSLPHPRTGETIEVATAEPDKLANFRARTERRARKLGVPAPAPPAETP